VQLRDICYTMVAHNVSSCSLISELMHMERTVSIIRLNGIIYPIETSFVSHWIAIWLIIVKMQREIMRVWFEHMLERVLS